VVCSCCKKEGKNKRTCGKADHPCGTGKCGQGSKKGGQGSKKGGQGSKKGIDSLFLPQQVTIIPGLQVTIIPEVPVIPYRLVSNLCAQSGCGNPRKYGAYCGKHRSQDTLQTGLEEAKQAGDLFACELFSELLDSVSKRTEEKDKNPLQPKFVTKTPSPAFRATTNTDFLKRMLPYMHVLQALLGPQTTCKKAIDQRKRAWKLAKMCGPNVTTVYLMDGHGAFTLRFLSNIKRMYGSARLNDLNVVIVDIVPRVTDYHHGFFQTQCGKIQCRTQKITDCPKGPENLIYMNFCGIARSLDEVVAFNKSCSPSQPLMISYSVARMKEGLKQNIAKQISHPNGAKFCKLKSVRKDFETVYLKPT